MSQEWNSVVARYQKSVSARAVVQLVSTLILLFGTFFLMFKSLDVSYLLTLGLAVPASLLLVRTFVIMHDCAHGSFFASRRANTAIGWITGVLTLTPFEDWRHEHAMHHASSGDLSRRGRGDLHTLTVTEYLNLSRWGRLQYRLFRHPLVMFGLGPVHVIIRDRYIMRLLQGGRLKRGIILTDVAIVLTVTAFSLWIGLPAVLLIYVPTMYLAAVVGIWLFYVQHQFEDTYWTDHEEWDYATAAIKGSSYLKLPGILNWFTGSIGLHHVHHLGPRIPNYRLKQCHEENDLFHGVTTLGVRDTFAAMRLKLWCEDRRRLIGFGELRAEI